MKFDTGKPQWHLLRGMLGALDDVLRVRAYGVEKYGDPDNWMTVTDGHRRYVDAAMRHLARVVDGEHIDPESGLPHLAHAACSVLFALALRPKMSDGETRTTAADAIFAVCRNVTIGDFTRSDCIKAVQWKHPGLAHYAIEKHVDEFIEAYMAKPIVPVEDIKPRSDGDP